MQHPRSTRITFEKNVNAAMHMKILRKTDNLKGVLVVQSSWIWQIWVPPQEEEIHEVV
jgi:hypothetical protein